MSGNVNPCSGSDINSMEITVCLPDCGEFLEKNRELLQGGEIQMRVFKKFRGCLEKVLQKGTEVANKQSKKSRISSMKNTFFFNVKTFKEIIDYRLSYLLW